MSVASTADWAAAIAAGGAAIAAFLSVYAAFEMNKRTKMANRTSAFAERFQVFEISRECMELVLHRKPDRAAAADRMREAVRRAWFLFPIEFVEALERMRHDLVDATPMEDVEGGHSQEVRLAMSEAIKRVNKNHRELNAFFAPHMRIED